MRLDQRLKELLKIIARANGCLVNNIAASFDMQIVKFALPITHQNLRELLLQIDEL